MTDDGRYNMSQPPALRGSRSFKEMIAVLIKLSLNHFQVHTTTLTSIVIQIHIFYKSCLQITKVISNDSLD